MKRFITILLLLHIFSTFATIATAQTLLLLHEKMRQQREANRLTLKMLHASHRQKRILSLRLKKIKIGEQYVDSTYSQPTTPDLDKAFINFEKGQYKSAFPTLLSFSKDSLYKNKGRLFYQLAYCHYFGKGTSRDYIAAIEALQKNRGYGLADAQSCFLLARCYRYGRGVEKDMAKCDSLLLQSARYGLEDAIELLQIEKDMSREELIDWLLDSMKSTPQEQQRDDEIEDELEEIRKRKEAIEKRLGDSIKDQVPKFGLG